MSLLQAGGEKTKPIFHKNPRDAGDSPTFQTPNDSSKICLVREASEADLTRIDE